MEDDQHSTEPTATPKLYISDLTSGTPGAVELSLEILPAFNLRSTEVVLVELFIDGKKRGQSLVKGSSPDRKTAFTVSKEYLRAGQRKKSHVLEADFHITHGILIRPAPSEPKSLTKIKGSTYKVHHQLTNQNLYEAGHRDNSDFTERDKTDNADDESSQEHFYDARSQLEHLQHTSTAGEDPTVGYLATDEKDSRADILATATHDSTAEHGFYDVRSQFENLPETPTAEEDPIIGDLAGAGRSSIDGDQRILASGDGQTTSSAVPSSESYVQIVSSEVPIDFVDLARRDASSKEPRPASRLSPSHNWKGGGTIMKHREQGMAKPVNTRFIGDDLARLDHAKRVIFKEDSQSIMEFDTAPSSAPVNATSPSIQDPSIEMLDGPNINTEQSENDDIAPHQKKPMQTFGTISKYLSSNKSAAQHGINSDSVDPGDEAASLVRNPKPLTLRRTSFASPGSALQPDISNGSVDNNRTKEASLNGKDDSDTGEIEIAATAPSSMKRKDPAKQKAYNANRAASGARVNGELRKRLADNGEKIGVKGAVLKLWRGKNLGDDQNINAANSRLGDVIKKQAKLHNLLSASTDVDAASDLRQILKPWAKGKIDEYESQLDGIFSAVQDAPSSDLTAPKQRANDDSSEDSDDGFALPLMSSQQQRMAAALLPEDQPVRKSTEDNRRASVASDQQLQPFTSPTIKNRDNDTPEDSDDDGLLDFEDLIRPAMPRRGSAKTHTARDAHKSEG